MARVVLAQIEFARAICGHAKFYLCYSSIFTFWTTVRCMTILQLDCHSGLYIAGHYTGHYTDHYNAPNRVRSEIRKDPSVTLFLIVLHCQIEILSYQYSC